ncbi:MAG: sensor histidine kinase [Caldilineaceae bacterium SB0670_bin_27]|uniref:histidine kinase n=1 Tax=Caldilineaceae bacterium SB0664_bin_27 TaxID=2605260 RepID=A0A6B0YVK0_9CHLR|nr:sensor histidine kinase [Caldilineaceae bacterium]MDE0340227.1 sensor histidine kinase [Caldilineaceae bacterium]MXY95096.1 sensor histidine kinase [Caldilineaceae bacterium SB0664_bin_27]MYJ77779.1 sensor histidine kinase [Caldilineaceae bacterium SB0670_bin_27]
MEYIRRFREIASENLLMKIGAQVTILSVLVITTGVRGKLPMQMPLCLILLFLFNLLIWCRSPVAKDRTWLGVHLYFALQFFLFSWLLSLDVLFGLLSTILYVQIIVLARGRSRPAWLLLLLAVVAVGNFLLHPEPSMLDTPLNRALVFQAFIVFVTLMILNQLRAKRRGEEVEGLVAELMDKNRLLQEYAAKIETLAATAERRRISRELHDELGHRLTAAAVLTDRVPQLLSENRTRRAIAAIDNVSDQLHQGLTELREIVHAFHTAETASEFLPQMLQRLTDEYTALHDASIQMQLDDVLALSLSDDQKMTVYRIVQESLTNASKHAQAQNIHLNLKNAGDELVLTVRNDGRDFVLHEDSTTFGLQGMHARAAHLGGTVTVKRPDDGGALVTLTIPLCEDPKPNLLEIRKVPSEKEYA